VLVQYGVVATVTDPVALKLWVPVLRVRFGLMSMLGTGVPEAAVDEDGHAFGWEDEVRPTAKARDYLAVLEEA